MTDSNIVVSILVGFQIVTKRYAAIEYELKITDYHPYGKV